MPADIRPLALSPEDAAVVQAAGPLTFCRDDGGSWEQMLAKDLASLTSSSGVAYDISKPGEFEGCDVYIKIDDLNPVAGTASGRAVSRYSGETSRVSYANFFSFGYKGLFRAAVDLYAPGTGRHSKVVLDRARGATAQAAASAAPAPAMPAATLGSMLAGSGQAPAPQRQAALGGGLQPQPRAPEPEPEAPRQRPSSVDTPGYRAPEIPDNFALIIGIQNYENLPPADFAERDAAAVRAHLLALGYPERNIIYLTGSKASRTGIAKYMETWLPLNVKPTSRVFVYFSGHGAPDPSSGQAYLVPWDGDAKFLKNTGYPLKQFYQDLNALKAKEIVLAMDSCFSGEGGRSVLAKGARPLVTKVDTGVSAGGKLVVLAAAGGDEITGSTESEGHGLFTYYLLKGLKEKGSSATVSDLYKYLLPRVQDEARRDGREQTPQLLPRDLGAKAGSTLR